MRWQTKLTIQNLIAILPRGLGDPLYHAAQSARGLKPNCVTHCDFVTRCAQLLRDVSGADFHGKSVVELGSGWFPLTPLILACRGAREVHTFDLHEHYSRARIAAAAVALQAFRDEFADHPILRDTAAQGALPPAIHYHPRTDIVAFPTLGAADVAISRAVLEHVEPGTIVRIHKSSSRWLRPEGVWIHMVSPSDHRAYHDTTLHLVDFLRYSEQQWARLAGNRFAYHNRLRRPQFIDLFQQAGWVVEKEDFGVSPAVVESLTRVTIHPLFRKFSPEDLVASSLWFVLGRRERGHSRLHGPERTPEQFRIKGD